MAILASRPILACENRFGKGSWGVFTVHCGVLASERDFDHYMRTGTLRNPMMATRRWRAIGDVNAFVGALDFERWLRRPLGRRIQSIVDNVHGLGYAKTAFALTCGGFADVPCLDVWALRVKLGVETRAWRNVRAYLNDCNLAFKGSARNQWAFYWHLNNGAGRAFRRTSHAPVFAWLGVDTERQGKLL